MRKSALALSLVATGGVILFGVLWGIAVAVILAILLFFRRSWWPHGSVLGRVDGVPGLAQRREVPGRPSRSRASSCTAGKRRSSSPTPADSAEQVRHLAREHEPDWIVLQCEAITDVDVTAAEMLEQLDDELNADGDPPGLRRDAQPPAGPRSCRYGLLETLDRDHFYPTLKAAVKAVEALGPLPPAEPAPGGHGHFHHESDLHDPDDQPLV